MHVRPKWIFLRIHTDIGLSGVGEATCGGRGQTVATTVNEMARYLVGKDPMQIERHWQLLFRGNFRRQGPVVCSALGGIEMALWDIKGKVFGCPVWQLLGGKVRDKIKLYGHVAGPVWGTIVAQYARLCFSAKPPLDETVGSSRGNSQARRCLTRLDSTRVTMNQGRTRTIGSRNSQARGFTSGSRSLSRLLLRSK